MPQHKSCKKRLKTSAIERMRNRDLRSRMKKSLKDLKSSKTRKEAEAQVNKTFSIIDKASHNSIIHKNKAARDKSKLTLLIKKLPD